MHTWPLNEAKAKMSALLREAQHSPQEITSHGKSVAVVLSREQFDQLAQRQKSLVEFMRQSPLWGDEDLALERDRSLTREVSF
ncbi:MULTISPECIES: type II toxin-antitoxin system Phd/YefM family antitoxin [Methylocaldum]|jgi:prevent-host-death family protein|uniref:type II toxin-antitoxin system Phd/YefM family antitoxin n=1 Tax=unclassified Methylocaldum TaxID=2622260 RepID=UPI000989F38A|nr:MULTISPECIES: type II toxin-antitoxin system Phd/YefM family antitoxin [unclassified Methylocaldum]MBP1150883.1 prevent-host-death family protein [Methylocaldum sp. RMAD-M]